ncbi:MAG: hypothetical protein ACE5J9_02925 [Methanosarcinales archaeon]
MEMEFNKDQLLGLARGIGKALYEDNQAILKSGDFALSCIINNTTIEEVPIKCLISGNQKLLILI